MGNRQRAATPRDGDIFTIPLGDGRVSVGQVISSFHSAYYIVVRDFAVRVDELPLRLPEALGAEPVLAGLTFDALIGHGHWKVVDNGPVDGKKYLPAYKTGTAEMGNCMIEDFKGEVWRPATAVEAEIIPFRENTAPIRFEKAMKAHMGLEPWDDSYERIRVGDVVTSADIFGW
ncbi:immunity 26/phosphotriesterase HocA family protein [Arthrobacter zhangbolii]|uniref:Immunity 26/phosphotriesterase HocA family protein n=1 Tax=Arthrobacter zhangbolii TaxID=2886936 RepID=A0A9X1M5N9_9MICC|nr:MULTISPECIES: immunity 26/phosphotriesterase HocA family protein [Arthrobacter]MCC3271701.1 immunity 26/phosphotriesterase HocA family protein [Arthrobacter zhangbolii]MDN3904771.1 immunity 26/phosphotriesterase HocA family protein [Arthrobacter sp. YD2]UON93470.1 immunity 26/phosphotriesterase HocA family protein [Arthrobacter zhangbolii]